MQVVWGDLFNETKSNMERWELLLSTLQYQIEAYSLWSIPHTEADFEEYLGKLHSKSPDLLREALQVLERFAVTEAIPAIRSRLAETKNALTRRDLVHALWVIGLDEVVEDLVAFLDDEHRWVRDEACSGLKFLASEGNKVAKANMERAKR